jgi:hypothetical protein
MGDQGMNGPIFKKNGQAIYGLQRPYSDFNPLFQVTPLKDGVVRVGAGMLNGRFVSPVTTAEPSTYDSLGRAWLCLKTRIAGDIEKGYAFRGISYANTDSFLSAVDTPATALRAFREGDEYVSYYPIAMFRSNGEFHQIVSFPLMYQVGPPRYDGVSRIGGISHYWFSA